MPPDLFDLQDRVVVITGGLGQLGAQFAGAIVQHGGRAAILDLDVGPARRPVLPAGASDRVLYLKADIRERAKVTLDRMLAVPRD